jgi:hypothetical protein
MGLCVAAALLVFAAITDPFVSPRRAPPPTPAAGDASPPVGAATFSAPPLATLTETVERPIFSSNRRPAAPDQPGPALAAPIRKGDFVLVGVSIQPDRRDALLRRNSTGTLAWAAEGEKLGDWVVKAIQPDRVTLEQGSEREELELWSADNKPPAPPPARTAAPRPGSAPTAGAPRPLQAAPQSPAPAARAARPPSRSPASRSATARKSAAPSNSAPRPLQPTPQGAPTGR